LKILTGGFKMSEKKFNKLIDKLDLVADFIEHAGMSEDIELICSAIDDLVELKEEYHPTPIKVSKKVKDIISKEERRILCMNALNKISGGYCIHTILDAFDNGWEIEFTYGIQSDCQNSRDSHRSYLRNVMLEPEY
jgi:hypothetical protein